MRKKTRSTKRTTKSSQGEVKLADQSTASIVFVDENSSEAHVQDQQNKTIVEENIKDDTDRVIAVIDKKPTEERIVEDEEEDDVPEDVSWKASKENAIRERTLEKEILLDVKRKEKQMRIERNERLREQKERKRAREYSRLPMEVLQEVAKQQESQAEEEIKAVTQTVGTGDHVTFDSSSEDECEEQNEETEETPAIKVLVLPKEAKKPKKIQQSASLFLRGHLFGDRIERISATKNSDRNRKRKGNFGPAANFF